MAKLEGKIALITGGKRFTTLCRSAGSVHLMKSPRPWFFLPPTIAAISLEPNYLWMAASPRCHRHFQAANRVAFRTISRKIVSAFDFP